MLLGAGGGGEGQQLSPRGAQDGTRVLLSEQGAGGGMGPRGAQDALRMGMEQVNPRLCIFLSESGNTHDHTNA